jgi:hypothetical protein
MKKEKFVNGLHNYKKFIEDLEELEKIGFNLFDGKYSMVESVEPMLDNLLSLTYNQNGVDLINWYIYETDWGENDTQITWTENDVTHEEFINTPEELFDFLETKGDYKL